MKASELIEILQQNPDAEVEWADLYWGGTTGESIGDYLIELTKDKGDTKLKNEVWTLRHPEVNTSEY